MALSFERVSVRLARRPVLHDIDLRFAAGRITAILGPNGAGKSSLLRAAAGLVAPAAGRVRLDGSDLAAIDARTRAMAIGYLPQDAVVHWNMPARDLVALGRMPHRDRDEEAIAAALAATRTADLGDRPVRELSGGERARVLLARVLAGRPRWLLADEPLASLDPLHQLDTLAMLRAIAASGTGVLLVLHDLNHAARIADDIVLLKDGRLVATGPRETVLTAGALAEVFGVRVSMNVDEDGLPVIVPVAEATGGGLKI